MFANTFTQTDFELFSSSVMGICEISLWISNITSPPSRVLFFLYTLYGQDSGNNSEFDIHRDVNFCLLSCHNLRLIKDKESQQLKFLISYTIDVYVIRMIIFLIEESNMIFHSLTFARVPMEVTAKSEVTNTSRGIYLPIPYLSILSRTFSDHHLRCGG